MIDLHCHILPGLDDGPSNIEAGLELARAAVKEGINTIVATPHCIPEVFSNEREHVLKAFKQLQDRLLLEEIPLRIVPGMEVHLTLDVAQRLSAGTVLTIGDLGKYVLLELPANSVPGYAEQIIFEVMLQGIRPILAHPERNREIIENPHLLYQLIEKGCLVQVTSYSLTGQFGSTIQNLTKEMVRLGWVDFIASDAHGLSKRPVALREAYQVARELVGEESAGKLILDNPRRILEGKDIVKGDVLPYPSDRNTKSSVRKKGFWFGLSSIFRK